MNRVQELYTKVHSYECNLMELAKTKVNGNNLLTIPQVVHMTKYSRATIYRWINSGFLKSTRMNNRTFIKISEIIRLFGYD